MKRKMITFLTLAILISASCVNAYAASNVNVYLPPDQKWGIMKSDVRTGSYSYALAACNSVYPKVGTDNYKKMQARITDNAGKCISTPFTVLTEGTGYEEIKISEGNLSIKQICFQFRGNTAADAYAIVSYQPK